MLEVQPNEPALRSYLRARFPSLPDIDDVVQETYRRLLRERAAGRLRHTRGFLFTAARNVALDFFRQNRPESLQDLPHSDVADVIEEQPDVAEVVSRQQELEILAEALRQLPDRCRHVMLLRYFKGLTYKEVAAALGISTETVKTHMATGLRRCTEHFAARGLLPPVLPEEEEVLP
jgi:RNA polymerase sigma factor (sigma-70 family)